ncbi:thioredoxin domain-containing protein [Sphingomonas sp.]|uniref:thioredoxin domain-containing protein n=1 Tax=Sphingomonas sp. TaxID=28214 RepID=UPI003CC6D1CF
MRLLTALAALFALAAAAPPRDWTVVAAKTPAGYYVVGNPRAPVRLIEYVSYTCSHCAAFSVQAEPVLAAQMVRSGSTSVEVRHFLFNALDLGVVVLARCTGPRRFLATTAFIYRTQDSWLDRAQLFQQANGQRLNMYPPLARLRALVDGSGLTSAIEAQGLAPAAVDACFADQAEVDRLTAGMNAIPAGIDGTPSFLLNGRLITHVGWTQLEPQLRAAGAH